jgi:3-phosphoshikimate 1-carboxyvinyltransferase
MPGDKSIAHRALIFGTLSRGGPQIVHDIPQGDDLAATLDVLVALGASFATTEGETHVLHGPLRAPRGPIHCGESGTTLRLMAGVLAACGIEAELTGDPALLRRPMERIAAPLRAMGAHVETTDGHGPVRIKPAPLRGIEHRSEVASAQVKSCVLLAGLAAEGRTTVHEPVRSRDHTERLLQAMGVKLEVGPASVSLESGQDLRSIEVHVPGDLSSAAFPIAAALLVPGSEVEVTGVGLNPTRTGFLEALDAMGARVEVAVEGSSGGEPSGRIVARGGAELAPLQASGELVVRAIDELPALFVLAAFARGRSVFRDAGELRTKESDRIAVMARGLRALGIACEELPDGLAVEGDPGRVLHAESELDGAGDHRIVMALACAALRARGGVRLEGVEAVDKSYPRFFKHLARLRS